LTTTSHYAGTLSAFTLGTRLRSRYSHLLPSPSSFLDQSLKPVTFWSASSRRDVETALYLADGLFGRDWSGSSSNPNTNTTATPARLHIIPELASRGGNTLTPSRSCLNYQTNETHGRDQGYLKLAEWQSVFSIPISRRLSAQNPGLPPLRPNPNPNPNPNLDPTLKFSPGEIYSMFELCGFEILSRGSSPWCALFSHSEWEDFAYARDILHFYRAGPGNMYAGVLGTGWLEAVAELLNQGSPDDASGSGEIYASFVHDGDLVPVLAALGVFDEDRDGDGDGAHFLPTDRRKKDRRWQTSDLVPMAGHLVIERLNCRTPHGWSYRDVRLFVNDGWVGWSVDGAGKEEGRKVFVPQVEVGRFKEIVARKREEVGGFGEVCGLEGGVEEGIGFLHQ
jgi:acid phosphatase